MVIAQLRLSTETNNGVRNQVATVRAHRNARRRTLSILQRWLGIRTHRQRLVSDRPFVMFTYQTPHVVCSRGKERSFEKGLSTTRFHKGFQRRMQSHIQQDAPRLEREASKQRLSLRHLDRRRQRLRSLDKRNGFNLITGEFDAGNRRCTTPFHIKPITVGIYLCTNVCPPPLPRPRLLDHCPCFRLETTVCDSRISNNATVGPIDASHKRAVLGGGVDFWE